MSIDRISQALSRPAVLLGLLVFLLSYLTYFQNYAYPPQFFWDENYHIASAQKYLNGVYFMEPHPPLGKLLIALGEKIFHPNPENNQYIGTDYAADPPPGFSFEGYRFFPALLGWLTAPLVYLIFLLITRNALYAIIFSFLYIFDNALIVHTRGAMLESPLLFFSALTILGFLLVLETKNKPIPRALASLLFGAAFGAAMTTKDTSLIFVLLLPFLVWVFWHDRHALLSLLGISAVGFLCVFLGVWQIHFALGRTINPDLPDAGYYQATPAYQQILNEGRMGSPSSFTVMLRDSLAFTSHYAGGVPRLDLCKKDENGSPFYFWPLGARSINYRWETPDGTEYHYLYLQVNPVVWWASFAAILVGLALLASSVLLPLREPLKYRFLLTVFLTLYVCYMLAISRLDRVMYLYHYFPPLLFGFFVSGVVFLELERIGRWRFTEQGKQLALVLFGLVLFASFQFYRPLTYYQSLTDEQFNRRAILQLWSLTCVKCEKMDSLVVPCK